MYTGNKYYNGEFSMVLNSAIYILIMICFLSVIYLIIIKMRTN